jgi:HAMP domain-containing protein
MKFTIRRKLGMGFAGVLILMAAVAAIGTYSVYQLRRSAQDAVRIGARLNSMALEIQVHNLEAQRRVLTYLRDVKTIGPAAAREQDLEETAFEISELESLAGQAAKIAPGDEKRAKFQKVQNGVAAYREALDRIVSDSEKKNDSGAALAAYETAAERLHEAAEDGEAAGRDAAKSSHDDIEATSQKATRWTVGVSLAGLLLGILVSLSLARAILNPVDHMREVAESVSLGNLDVEVQRYSDDEIGDLAESFSRMVTAVKFFRMEAEDRVLEPAAVPGGES